MKCAGWKQCPILSEMRSWRLLNESKSSKRKRASCGSRFSKRRRIARLVAEMADGLKLYSTLSRKIEPFETIEPGVVRMYVCGVTPYANAHIGHAMSAIVFDMIRRYLEHRRLSGSACRELH